MSAVQHEVVQVGTRTLVRLSGELAVSTAPTVRTALTKCLVEQPDMLVVVDHRHAAPGQWRIAPGPRRGVASTGWELPHLVDPRLWWRASW